MNLRNLTEGVYRLPEPIDNPKPDGRRASDWRYAQSFSGGRYIVRVYEYVETFEVPRKLNVTIRKVRIENPDERGADIMFTLVDGKTGDSMTASDKRQVLRARALAERLVSDESIEGALVYARTQDHIHGSEVLLYLVECGVVSEDAVRVAIRAVHEREVAEHEAREAKWRLENVQAASGGTP